MCEIQARRHYNESLPLVLKIKSLKAKDPLYSYLLDHKSSFTQALQRC